MPDPIESTATPAAQVQDVPAESLFAELPAVNEAAIRASETDAAAAPRTGTAASDPGPEPERDAKGTPFDAERHIRTKHPRTGCWMPKRRPASTGAPPNAAGFVAPDPEPPPPAPPPSEYRIAAEGACQITYALGMMLGGDEWTPTSDDHARLLPAWETYLQTKGVKDVPPGMALAIAMIGYVAPRMRKPKTLSTLAKVRMWWINRKANIAARRAAEQVAAERASAGQPASA